MAEILAVQGRVLFLSEDPALIEAQLAGRDLSRAEAPSGTYIWVSKESARGIAYIFATLRWRGSTPIRLVQRLTIEFDAADRVRRFEYTESQDL